MGRHGELGSPNHPCLRQAGYLRVTESSTEGVEN